jgi:cellobiose phosphorylase
LRLEVDKLRFVPCLPGEWKGFTLHYRYRETLYHITITVLQVSAGNGEMSVAVDGVEQPDKVIPLVDDNQEHSVDVKIQAADS